jgi:hypothetical protein
LFQRLGEDERDREQAAANTLREYRTAQMAKLLHLFERARGRPPQDKDELVEWMQSKDTATRARTFYAGVALVALGFIGQLVGSLPYGITILGFRSCS